MPRKRARTNKEQEPKERPIKKTKCNTKGYVEELITALTKSYNNNGKK